MNVVSFCLYGTAEHYRVGAIKNVELCRKHYPGWEVFFYVSPTIPKDIVDKLIELDCYVNIVEAPDNAYFMNYRYLPCVDPDVDIAIFRDTDSRVDEREAAAVNEWLASGKGLHIMRDHPWHLPHPDQHMILGGMWGLRCDKLRDFDKLANLCHADTVHGADQRLLTKYVYPRFLEKNDIFVHDEFFNKSICTSDKHQFPMPRASMRVNGEDLPLFVGCQFDENDKPLNPYHLQILQTFVNSIKNI